MNDTFKFDIELAIILTLFALSVTFLMQSILASLGLN